MNINTKTTLSFHCTLKAQCNTVPILVFEIGFLFCFVLNITCGSLQAFCQKLGNKNSHYFRNILGLAFVMRLKYVIVIWLKAYGFH